MISVVGDRLRGLRRRPDGEEWRASWFELFFDLVFVLVVSQLSGELVSNLTLSGALETLFLLLMAWWAWIYTTWTTNWFDPDTGPMRILLTIGMFGCLLGAVAIPEAFGDRALLLVLGYATIQLVRNLFVVVACERDDPLRPALQRVLAWSLWVAPLWIIGALLEGDARIAIWIVALVADYAGPVVGHWIPGLGRSRPSQWELEPSHFAERLLLFLIIALGEVIVAMGRVAAELPDRHVSRAGARGLVRHRGAALVALLRLPRRADRPRAQGRRGASAASWAATSATSSSRSSRASSSARSATSS